jgi:heptosyltransferase I
MKPLPDLRDCASALILKPSSLGDIVHTLPAVAALHQAFPHLQLRWVVNTEWAPLLAGIPWLSAVIPFPRQQCRGALGPWRAYQWAQAELPARGGSGAECVLDFQGLLRSALLAKASRSKPIIGLSDAREGARFFYHHTVPVDAAGHAVDRYLTLVKAMGADIREPTFSLAPGRAPAGWGEVEKWLNGQQPVILHPWSRGAGKSLSQQALQAMCAALAPLPILLVGRTPETWRPQGDHVRDLSGQTSLEELIWLLRQASWVISVDSGPMHMAAAITAQTVGIHTWSDPRQVGPYSPAAWVWKAGKITHRQELTALECTQNSAFGEADAAAVAEFVKNALEMGPTNA